METVTASSIFVSIVCIIVLTGLLKAINWVWLKPKKLENWLRQQGMSGTSYKLFYGDLNEISSMRTQALNTPMTTFTNHFIPRVESFRHKLVSEFGKDYFIWNGPTPMVNISKPELIREALTNMQDFQKPRMNPFADQLYSGLVNYEGEKWAKHRKLVNPAFKVDKLKLMLPAFYESCVEMIDKWEKITERGSSEHDVWPDITTLSADVISRAAFGSSYKEGQRVFELLREQLKMALTMLQSVYIPGLRYIPTPKNRKFKKAEEQIQTSLKRIINKRKAELKSGAAVKTDMLGILLDSNLKETQQSVDNVKHEQLELSIQEVINECKVFYFAGQETTSLLLVWTLLLLSKHQDWQARAREEVLETFGNHVPDFEGLSHLKIMGMILNEVLRLYPPGIQITRRVCKNTKLGELSLKAGTLISLPVLFVHHDTEIWGEDAAEFNPERFSEGISMATKGNISFFPFSWGPRICIGEKFSLMEAKMALSMILRRFWFELSPNYAHAPMSVILLQPQHGAPIILHRL